MIVIDASVAAKWVLDYEQDTAKALVVLEKHKSLIEEIIVPDLLFYEVANMLATKSRMRSKEMFASLNKIYQAGLKIYYPLEIDVTLAARLAKRYKTSVYDMLYAVVAKKHKVKLITADEQFVKQTGFKFVQLLLQKD